jgi:hypothetical protein
MLGFSETQSVLYVYMCSSSGVFCLCVSQGPAGKDGLPGHPGQRGETVSTHSVVIILHLFHSLLNLALLLSSPCRVSKARLAHLDPQEWLDLR